MENTTLLFISLVCLSGLFLLAAVAVVVWLQNRQADRESRPQQWTSQQVDPGIDWLESLANQPAERPEFSGDLLNQIAVMVAEGRKIEAIKIYREATGAGLKEAKEAVEAIERR